MSELDWPAGFERTDPADRQRNNRYEATLRQSIDDLEAEFAVACDAYSRLRDNVRTLYLYIREKRKMEQRPVMTGESEFANARLPPGDDEREAVVAREPPHETLGVAPDADRAVVKAAARQLLKKHHPDRGGDPEEFRRVQDAREALLDDY